MSPRPSTARGSRPAAPKRATESRGWPGGAQRLTCSLRDMDRYLWLTGQYRGWLRNADEAMANSELRSLFEYTSEETQEELRAVLPRS
jgi:hypothetical protein